MSLAKRLTRTPHPFEPERGAEAAALFPDAPPEVRELIAGAAGCSPFLKSLMEKETGWFAEAICDPPEKAMAGVLAGTRDLGPAELNAGLRQAKRQIALLVAIADLGGVWALEEVTGALTDFADLAVDCAMKAMIAAEIARGKLPGATEDDIETAAGMVALAMGKMGAGELNYSSDIDLICLFDGDRYDTSDYHEARASLVRATRRMASLLSELTGDGYVFRTDLRLRPDASVTPVCLSMDAAESYYESVGRTWERAAYIKARPCAGDIGAGDRFLKRLTPFVWRKHLDFAAIQDAHDMRLRIREHKGLQGRLRLESHNIKLGTGGIREIEFFTQTRQIIAGGRDPSLRVRGTLDGLDRLTAKDWVAADTAAILAASYRAHREVEHRLQMIHDAQTHELPQDAEGFDRLAAFMATDTQTLRSDLHARLTEVHRLTEGFFAPDAARPTPEMPDATRAVVERWHGYPALRSSRAVEIFERLRPEILARLQRASKPQEALEQFDAFLAGLPAGVQVFSLFAANPQLIDLIVDIAATAPALSRYLGRNAQVFDAVIGGSFFDPWPGAKSLRQLLSGILETTPDYERRLDAARAWHKEWHFRIGVHHLRGLIDARAAGQHYADLADAVLSALWGPVVQDFAAKHGSPPGRGAVVLGMGSLGAAQLSATSDLDLIVIYDPEDEDTSQGPRPLPARSYFARLTQAFVTALTAPMAEGVLYEVDMRLRPSGRQGPVATSLTAFRDYQRNEAWTWEHLALTRARPIAGDDALAGEIEAFRRDLMAREHEAPKVLADVTEMRARLAQARPGEGGLEVKQGPGRMQDIELLAQTTALLSGAPERDVAAQLRAGWLPDDTAQRLEDIHARFWVLQAAARLLTGTSLDIVDLGEGGCAFLSRQTGCDNLKDLERSVERDAGVAAKLIDAALGQDAASAATSHG